MTLCPFEWWEQVANITLCSVFTIDGNFINSKWLSLWREGSVLIVYIIQSFQKFLVSPFASNLWKPWPYVHSKLFTKYSIRNEGRVPLNRIKDYLRTFQGQNWNFQGLLYVLTVECAPAKSAKAYWRKNLQEFMLAIPQCTFKTNCRPYVLRFLSILAYLLDNNVSLCLNVTEINFNFIFV